MQHHWRPLAHDPYSIFKFKQHTVNDPKRSKQYNHTKIWLHLKLGPYIILMRSKCWELIIVFDLRNPPRLTWPPYRQTNRQLPVTIDVEQNTVKNVNFLNNKHKYKSWSKTFLPRYCHWRPRYGWKKYNLHYTQCGRTSPNVTYRIDLGFGFQPLCLHSWTEPEISRQYTMF